MRLLLFSAYYEPEIASSLYLSTNLYEDFAKSDNDVNLFVPIPTRGVDDAIRVQYKRNKIEEKCKGKLKIHRIPMIKEGKNPILRILRYLLMNILFIWKGIRTKTDLIFVQSTPPTQGAMAVILKKLKKVPFVYNLQDIFPDSLVNAGMIKEGSIVWKIGRAIENFTYRNADRIIVVSEDIKRNIIMKGVPSEKIEVVYNWVETDSIVPIHKEDNSFYEKFNLNKSVFYVVYAGNLGHAQNIDVILEAAKLLQEHSDIQFLIFGKGAQERVYKKKAYDLSLNNVRFLPIQPYEKVSDVYSLGDVSIVSCKAGFGGSAMPSKTWSIMSTGTAVLASFDEETDMQKIIESNNLGIFTVAGDDMALKEAIYEMYSDRNACRIMGENGRKYILDNLTRNIGTKRYIDILNTVREENKNVQK